MERLDEAIAFATRAHAGQVRKLVGTPYILHPLEVAGIAATMTADEDVMAAAVLHDIVEDCGVTFGEIEGKFGSRVAELVKSETEERKTGLSREDTWMRRKEESLRVLRQSGDRDVKILWLADKLSNMRSFYRGYCEMGAALWERFHQKDPARQEWYYRCIAECVEELSGTAAHREFRFLCKQVFGGEW